MTITVLVAVTGHVVMAGIYNAVLLPPALIPFALSKHLGLSCFFIWRGDPNLHS